MRPFRGSLWCCALAALAMANGSAQAAWNNVFQVCCHNCQSSNYVAAPMPAAPAPVAAGYNGCQQCTTRYVQRCYYQPVTTYRQSSYMEPVTTYRTSYYYEPCTSYRYSCYYDPCTCRYQQVSQPVTTYRLRSQCCPVTSYLQRCCLQPVTTYQQMTYYEPQTTCCQTTIGAPVAAPPCGASVVPSGPPPAVQGEQMVPPPAVSGGQSGPPPAVSGGQTGPPPAVSGGQIGPPPAVSGGAVVGPPAVSGQSSGPPPSASGGNEPLPPGQGGVGTSNYNRVPYMPGSEGSSYRQPRPQAPVQMQPVAPVQRPPQVRFDRITSTPRHNAEGQVVRSDRQPQAGMRVIFVCADEQGGRQSLTTDGSGRFQTTLASGTWIIYTQDGNGRLVYQQKMRIATGAPTAPITLVSR
ncbi:MAG: hypothetical protein ACYC3I_22480 [Gemmataceae bacterium]